MSTSIKACDKPVIELWFDFGSNYSYLSTMRIEALASAAGAAIAWKPFLLGVVYKELGWKEAPFLAQPEKGRYVWQDTKRRAKRYGIEFNMPTAFPRVAVLPSRVAILCAHEPWIGDFCKNVMRQNWVLDLDINDPIQVTHALSTLVENPQRIIDAAQEDTNKLKLREQTQQAREKGIFGAPTFFVNDEMFWGDDRLEDALYYLHSLQNV